ncbi:MAG: hypothetical protein AAFQ43_00480 [Bacteroidota bacterium]
MSVRNQDRCLDTSESVGAARTALAVVAFYGHDDGVLDNSKYSRHELARRGGMDPDTWTRATKELARMGELVILNQVGRYPHAIYGVVCGLYGLDRLEVVHAAWARAALRGGTYSHLDDLTMRASWTAVEPVMLDVQRRSLVVINPGFNGDISSVNGDEASSLTGGLSIDVFLVSRKQQQRAGARGGEGGELRRLTPAQEKRRVSLQLLGVYELKARRYAADVPLAWVDQVIEAGRMIQGGTKHLGAAVCKMMEGEMELPPLSPEAPEPRRVVVTPETPADPPLDPEDVRRFGVRATALLYTHSAEELRAIGEWQLAEERTRRDSEDKHQAHTHTPRSRHDS